MPTYMDRHDGITVPPEELYAAHLQDLEAQAKHGVNYLTYWADLKAGHVFCLVEAPSPEAAEAVHISSHGLAASKIIEVDESVVEAFLGRINDPPETSTANPIDDSAFRTIIFTDIEGSTALTQRLGDAGAMDLLRTHDEIVRTALKEFSGNEVKHTGDGIMASFGSATRAIESAILIQRSFHERSEGHDHGGMRVRVGLSAGEPVEADGDFFGASVQLARRVCDHADPGSILAANVVRELCIGKAFEFRDRGETPLKGFDDPVRIHEVVWAAE